MTQPPDFLSDPNAALDGAIAAAHAQLQVQFEAELTTDEERAWLTSYNAEMAAEMREQARVQIIANYRAAGVDLQDDWGMPTPPELRLVVSTPEGRA